MEDGGMENGRWIELTSLETRPSPILTFYITKKVLSVSERTFFMIKELLIQQLLRKEPELSLLCVSLS
ncbi:hypothetical protein GCM10008119_12110 [Pedobacter mendelii]|uniref:Uncharacterized protein n=1 Tax=Pedobacter mendelii TaxID=1908240 RepID=A0ABQ2BEQ6_9SPHI|nr:hypothetical protein GCM10008119_12110 [Pedobacter mendelii]